MRSRTTYWCTALLVTTLIADARGYSGFTGPAEGCWPIGNNIWQAGNGLTLESAARACSFDVGCAGYDFNSKSSVGAPEASSTFNFKRGCTVMPRVACGSASDSPNWVVTRDRLCKMPSNLKSEHGRRVGAAHPGYIAFIGCFGRDKDSARCTEEDKCPEVRDLIVGSGYTIESCAEACRAASADENEHVDDYTVFGLISPRRRERGVCHCGDFAALRGRESVQVPDEMCGGPCEDETAMVEARCGTKKYAAVYALKPPPSGLQVEDAARAFEAADAAPWHGLARRASPVLAGGLVASALIALLLLAAARARQRRRTGASAGAEPPTAEQSQATSMPAMI